MAYSTSKLTTVDDCNKAITGATERKEDLEFDLSMATRDMTSQQKANSITEASLLSVKAEITGQQAALATLPDGPQKEQVTSKLRRLNDRRENLEERLKKGGNSGLLLSELDTELMNKQVAEITAFITEVNTRKAAL